MGVVDAGVWWCYLTARLIFDWVYRIQPQSTHTHTKIVPRLEQALLPFLFFVVAGDRYGAGAAARAAPWRGGGARVGGLGGDGCVGVLGLVNGEGGGCWVGLPFLTPIPHKPTKSTQARSPRRRTRGSAAPATPSPPRAPSRAPTPSGTARCWSCRCSRWDI